MANLPFSEVQIKKNSKLKDFDIPSYQTDEAAGVDLSASIENSIKIRPWEREIIPCGISIAMPKGLEAQIRPRSGLAFKHGITILNTPGTIDSDYRGEIKVVLINLSKDEFTIHPKDRIAQMVFTNAIQVKFKEVQNALVKISQTPGKTYVFNGVTHEKGMTCAQADRVLDNIFNCKTNMEMIILKLIVQAVCRMGLFIQ